MSFLLSCARSDSAFGAGKLVSCLSPGTTTAESDLRYRALLLCQGIINAHDDEQNGFLPFFYVDVRGGRVSYQHSSWALDDSTFRNISALARVYGMTGGAQQRWLLPYLRRMLVNAERSLEIGGGVNAFGDRALMHNMSRGLMALSAMAQIDDDPQRWSLLLQRFLTRLLEIYSSAPGWETGQEFDLASQRWRSSEAPPATCGRTIGGLVRCYHVTRDPRALELARRFVEANLKCFGDDGQPLASAGAHFHSIADTLQGMLAFAALIGDRALLERCEQIYRDGLKRHGIDATGWFAEHVHWPQHDWGSHGSSSELRRGGEICCTANMVSCAILLGRAGYAYAFDDAERYVRNMLLASQLLDLSSADDSMTREPRWPEFRQRLVGNVVGFPSSNGAYDPTSPHLTQLCCPAQAAEALADVSEAIVTPGGAARGVLNVNLLFSVDHPLARVSSSLPSAGRVLVTPTRDAIVRIKAPSWSPAHSRVLRLRSRRRVEPLKWTDDDGYLYAGPCRAGQAVEFRFDLPARQSLEGCALQPHVRFCWRGNTIIDCDPKPELLPLFADRRNLGQTTRSRPARVA